MIRAANLSYSYTGGDSIDFPDITIADGDHTLILGRSGSGKTTLLHLLSGLRSPTAGTIEILENKITSLSQSELDRFRGKNIGMIFQVPHFIGAISVLENLTLAQSLGGNPVNSDRAKDILRHLNIETKASQRTNQLSVGEQQRVAIARALINSPKIIFADEPTSALDDHNTEQVINLLQSQAEEHNATLIVVTHDQRLKDNFQRNIEL